MTLMDTRNQNRPKKPTLPLLAGALAAGLILIHGGAVQGICQESNFTLEGKITEKSAGKLTVSTTDNIIFHVRYDDKTEIKRADASAGTAGDLKVGQTVGVAGELTESGEIVAKKIEIKAKQS
ncbi:MAG: hypothetical protein DMG21_04920 [Acidobacteria bacterium]|nr:MAG: hypothetical protein DMG21_04920 [Acidobacteriota bacterium]